MAIDNTRTLDTISIPGMIDLMTALTGGMRRPEAVAPPPTTLAGAQAGSQQLATTPQKVTTTPGSNQTGTPQGLDPNTLGLINFAAQLGSALSGPNSVGKATGDVTSGFAQNAIFSQFLQGLQQPQGGAQPANFQLPL